MKSITVDIKLIFTENEEADGMRIETHDVPITMILEQLNALTKGLAQQLVKESQEDIPEAHVEGYMDARIELDRQLLQDVIKRHVRRKSCHIEFAPPLSFYDALKWNEYDQTIKAGDDVVMISWDDDVRQYKVEVRRALVDSPYQAKRADRKLQVFECRTVPYTFRMRE
jgi:hypothetical protein